MTTNALHAIRATLTASLVERDAEVDAVLLALVAREHVLFVGPPGTAKSQLATGLTQALTNARCFSALLTKFTTPEELFGPLMLSALRDDRYARSIEGYAPTAHVLFIDEIWKASSAILNTTLTLLQERTFDNGGARMPCPLRVAIAASNEWPASDERQELGAVFDRFLIRRTVRPVSPQARDRLLYDVLPKVAPVATIEDVDAAANAAAVVTFGEDARRAYAQILDELAGAGIRTGDRRMRKATGIARAAAWIAGRADVQPEHLEPLGDVLWTDPNEAPEKCADIVSRIANPIGARLNDLLRDVDTATRDAAGDAAQRLTAIKKIEACEREAVKLSASGNGRAAKALAYIRNQRVQLQAAALGIDPAKAAQLLGLGA